MLPGQAAAGALALPSVCEMGMRGVGCVSLGPLLLQGEVGTKRLKVWVEGPHGKPQVDIWGDRYRMVLLVSGGIGITPMQSICNTLLKQSDAGRPLK